MSAPWGLPDEQGRYATWGLPPEHFQERPETNRPDLASRVSGQDTDQEAQS